MSKTPFFGPISVKFRSTNFFITNTDVRTHIGYASSTVKRYGEVVGNREIIPRAFIQRGGGQRGQFASGPTV